MTSDRQLMPSDRVQEEARELIAALVKRMGVSVTEVARQAGVAPSTLTRMYPTASVKHTLSARSLSKLRSLEQSLQAAPSGWTSPSEALSPPAVREPPTAFQGRHEAAIGLHIFASADPPEHGPLAASELEILSGNLTAPVQRVAWPLGDGGEDRYFLTYMPDDSMAPRFRSGDSLLIDRLKPPAAGSEVLVEFTDGSAAPDVLVCIALLVERNRSQMRLKQYGSDAAATIMRRDVARSYAIVGVFDDLMR